MSNLLPKYEKVMILRLYRNRFIALAFTCLIGLAIISIALLAPSYLLLKSNQITLTAHRDTLANYETSKVAQSLAATVTDINHRLGVFPDTEVTSSPLIAGLLDPVLKAKTAQIHLSNFTYTIDQKTKQVQIQISGIADSRGDLLAFAETLKQGNSFSNVMVPIASFIKDANVNFTVTATPLKS